MFLLSDEDKNIANYRDKIEKEKEKLDSDF